MSQQGGPAATSTLIETPNSGASHVDLSGTNAFGSWWVENVTIPFDGFVDALGGDAEAAAEAIFGAVITEIKTAGPAAVGNIVTAALNASKNADGSFNVSGALTAALTAAESQGVTIGQAALAAAINAAVGAFNSAGVPVAAAAAPAT